MSAHQRRRSHGAREPGIVIECDQCGRRSPLCRGARTPTEARQQLGAYVRGGYFVPGFDATWHRVGLRYMEQRDGHAVERWTPPRDLCPYCSIRWHEDVQRSLRESYPGTDWDRRERDQPAFYSRDWAMIRAALIKTDLFA